MLSCPGFWANLSVKFPKAVWDQSEGKWEILHGFRWKCNFFLRNSVQNLWKSVHIWQSYHLLCNFLFFMDHSVYASCIAPPPVCLSVCLLARQKPQIRYYEFPMKTNRQCHNEDKGRESPGLSTIHSRIYMPSILCFLYFFLKST